MKEKSTLKAVLLLISTLTVMGGAIVAPALPEIAVYFKEYDSEVLIKLILTMPALLIAVMAPMAGYIIDTFGRKQLLAISLVVFGVAGFSGYLIEDLYLLLFSRAILGLGIAGIMSATTTLIGDYFEGLERNQLLGMQGSFMAIGGVVYLNLAGILADWSWRSPFLVYLIAFLILPLMLYYIYEPKLKQKDKSSANPTFKEASKDNTWITYFIYIIIFVGMVFFYMTIIQIPFLLKDQGTTSNALIGLAISVATISGAITSMNYARFKKRLSFGLIYILAFSAMAIGYIIIGIASQYWLVTLGIGICGLGMGLYLPNGNLWLMQVTPFSRRGRAIGGLTSSLFLGQFMSPILIAPLITLTGSLNNAFWVSAILIFACAFLIFMLSPQQQPSVQPAK